MICTFGDTTDVTWWRELSLPVRAIVQRDGRLRPSPGASPGWEATDPAAAQAAYDELAGKTVKQAQTRIVELLQEAGRHRRRDPPHHPRGEVLGERHPPARDRHEPAVVHPLPGQGRAARPRQGAGLVAGLHARPLRELGQRPASATGTSPASASSACPSRSGTRSTPTASSTGCRRSSPTRPPCRSTPPPPCPPGYEESQRNQPGGFAADPDVMDTWATSSLTPQIVCGWVDDPDLFERTFPMDLRPQAHEIIRTWLFSTVVRSHYEHGVAAVGERRHLRLHRRPRPQEALEVGRQRARRPVSRSSPATAPTRVRYWAANGRPGMDVAFDEGQMKIGRRLAIKLLNASKFALGLGSATAAAASPTPLDRSMLAGLAALVDEATAAFDRYDYARALERTEALLLVLLRRLPRAGQEPGLRRRARAPSRPRPRSAPRSRRCSSCSRRSCPTSPKRSGRGGRRAASTARRGPTPRRCGPPPPTATRPCSRWPPRSSARSAGPSPRPSARCGPRSAKVVVTDTAERLAALAARRRRRLRRRRRRPSSTPLRPTRSPSPSSCSDRCGAALRRGRSWLPSRLPSSWPPSSWRRAAAASPLPTTMLRRGAGHLHAGLVERALMRPAELAEDLELRGRQRLHHEPDRDALGAEALDAPHLRLLEDLPGPRRVLPQSCRRPRLITRLGLGRCRSRRRRRGRAGRGPTAGSCCRPAGSARWARATRCRSTSRRRVVRSDTASTVPPSAASPTSTMSPTPYWSSTRMKMPARKSFTRLWAPKPRATPAMPGAGDERPEVDAELAEDRDDGDRPDDERRHRAQHEARASRPGPRPGSTPARCRARRRAGRCRPGRRAACA